MNNVIKPNEIINIVCNIYGLTFKEIDQKRRFRKIVEARYAIIYFIDKYNSDRLTLQDIGILFENVNYDYSTVAYAIKKYKEFVEFNKYVKKKYELIENKIKNIKN
ncbi:MAG: hypothetical protein LBF04_07190 [Prevotellaceae bacterium]|jgi:chromosomal replication initiation ATPase DnaA|nr:hypothetical protein [Prevotellaceae bacterium]